MVSIMCRPHQYFVNQHCNRPIRIRRLQSLIKNAKFPPRLIPTRNRHQSEPNRPWRLPFREYAILPPPTTRSLLTYPTVTTGESDDKQKSELSSKLGNPAGRGGSDAEMAATILYLAGPGGLFCNGEVIHPDVSYILDQSHI